MIEKTCNICHKIFILGLNGVADGCDKCLNIERDCAGRPWEPNEKEMILGDDDHRFVLKRKDAFDKTKYFPL